LIEPIIVNVLISFYHLIWTCLVLFSVPLFPFIKRLRLTDRLFSHGLRVKGKEKSIWVHVLSVGEVISAGPLIHMLKEKYPGPKVILTVKTRSGLDTAERLFNGSVDHILPMPLDFWWSIHRISQAINPVLYLVVETDLWPGTLAHLRHRGIPAILVNGRISPRTYRAHKRLAPVSRKIWELMDVCLMQTKIDRERLIDLGVDPSRVKLAGNIKFDREWEEMDETEKKEWYKTIRLDPNKRIWVAGSLHKGEFEIILDAFKNLKDRMPDLRLIVAPRKMEWIEDVQMACSRRGLASALKTELPETDRTYEVLILNTMGELGRVYGLAEVSFVGGSLVPVGGHNLLEPGSFGQPVLFGPYTHNFELMAEQLIESGGGRRVSDGRMLTETVQELLIDPDLSRRMGQAAREFVGLNRGALEIVKRELDNILAIS
jgi:3-deoxy-D-manno-octulosonic-acid transferase